MHKYAQFLSLLLWAVVFFRAASHLPQRTLERPTKRFSQIAETPASQSDRRTILIFGDSITAGYGLSEEQAFPALLQNKIDERGWPFTVINGGLSGDTSAGGLRRISWMLREPVDVFILELGGNDGLRGTSPEVTKQNLQQIINRVWEANRDTEIILAGMQIPPNLGISFTQRFREIFGELAEKNNAALIPFLLEGVGGIPALNQPDGIHPTAEGHEILAETVWHTLEPVLFRDARNAGILRQRLNVAHVKHHVLIRRSYPQHECLTDHVQFFSF